MGDPYASCPVDRLTQEFRLLTLQPNNNESIIKCIMRTYNPNDHAHYTALSYTWGDTKTHADIEINGARIPVRENLWDFLRQQLDHGNYGPFWIDTLCIQQSDMRERNHQVQMMRSIYSDARLVLVWLGKKSEDSDLAIRALEGINLSDSFTDEEDPRQSFVNGAKNMMTWTPEEARSISSLCRRRYWSRMWIIQEVLLARDVQIHCGPNVLEWSKFGQLYSYLNDLFLEENLYTDSHDTILTSPAMALVSMSHVLERPQRQIYLKILLRSCGNHKCEDIRDKIFALAGVATYGSNIIIDYRKSAKDVLLDAFYHESNRREWEGCWEEDPLFRFAELLEKIVQVPFPEAEVRLHVDHIRNLTLEKIHKADSRPSEKDLFKTIVPPQ
jgi:hypothetical protein